MLLGASIVVLLIAQRAEEPRVLAFERAASRVLGEQGQLTLVTVPSDLTDAESLERAPEADGIVELSWSEDGREAHLRCYVREQRRWLDRDISFGSIPDGSAREAAERGRLLGFAAASMFTEPSATTAEPSIKPEPPPAAAPERRAGPPTSAPTKDRALEFAGVASTGVRGDASGLGATAALRWRLHRSLWARIAVAGRTGNIPEAQASTRALHLGAGLATAILDSPATPWIVGARLDLWATYFEASHLSEDDIRPDKRSRWLPGTSLLAEAGYRFTESTGVFAAFGPELLFGRTEIYTHGNQVAVVPALRVVGEMGFRTGF